VSAAPRLAIRVGLAGNPNAGKTSLFNAITGAHHKVGNYPGVTVEKREGLREYRGQEFRIVDLPGIYSLTAYSLDEVVTRDFLLEERPDIVVDVLDSTNLERNLYLCLQFQELGIPIVGALNMSDEAEGKGIAIDAKMLSETLGIPLIKTVGTAGKGVEGLLDAILETLERGGSGKSPAYGPEIETRLSSLEKILAADPKFSSKYPARWIAIKLLENDSNAAKVLEGHSQGTEIAMEAAAARTWLSGHYGKDSEIVITEQRYGYIKGALREAVKKTETKRVSFTEVVDRILMNRIIGLPLFFAILWGIFKFTFVVGEYPAALLEKLFALLSAAAVKGIPPGLLQSLIVDGIIGGVGGVFSFVPLIVILFLCISILEDTGYMSRAAFLTDKILHAFGLHGQSFMPLMLGFGCTVPALMSTRTLKSPRDRIATILAVPFISCGAKLPVYVLLAGTFFPSNPGNVVMIIYFAGVVLSMLSTIFLRKTVLRGKTTPFVMELPPYRVPTVRGIFWHVWGKTLHYVKKAGTIILAASMFIWLITTFPKNPDISASAEQNLEYSVAGRIGKFIEPAIKPLGFNWKIGVALIPGFSAKELVVSTMGILYGAGTGAQETNATLRQELKNDPDMNPLVAIVLMVFILVMPPCFASLATIRAEAGDKWLAFQVVYSISLAWLLSWLVKIIGTTLG
jgi:ferrous iron transport protein B